MAMDFSSLFKDSPLLDENTVQSSNIEMMKSTSPDSPVNDKPISLEEETKLLLLPSTSNGETKPNCMNTPSSSLYISENTAKVKACNKSSTQVSKKRIKIRPVCNKCLKSFSSNRSLKRHKQLHNKEKTQLFKCDLCEFNYARKDQLISHLKDYQNTPYVCTLCNKKFCRSSTLKVHISSQHSQSTEISPNEIDNSENESNLFSSIAFKCCEENNLDLSDFLNRLKSKLENELLCQLNKKKYFKCFLTVEAYVNNSSHQENTEALKLYIDSHIIYIFSENDIHGYINKTFNEIIQQFLLLKTEWTLKKIEQLTLCTIQYNVL